MALRSARNQGSETQMPLDSWDLGSSVNFREAQFLEDYGS